MTISVINVLVVVVLVSSYYHSTSSQNEGCRDGRVRLVSINGDTATEGRAEVCITDEWKEVGYCGQIEAGATVICNQLGYSQIGAEAFEGRIVAVANSLTYLSCSGDETRVSECICEARCCQANVTLMVRCKPVECSQSIVGTLALGGIVWLLLILLVGSCITIVILGVKLKRTQRKGRYKSEPHHYEEQHIGRLQIHETGGPTYDDPITWKRKDSESADQKKGADYINTAKCVAYRQNPATTTTFCTLSLPSSQCRPASQADEYEVMQQLNYRGDT